MAAISSVAVTISGVSASDLFWSSSSGVCGVPLKSLGKARLGAKRRNFTVTAKLWKGKGKRKQHERPWPADPDPNVKGGVLFHLSHFKPLKEKPKPVILDFEKPLLDFKKQMADIQKVSNETGLDFSKHLSELEDKHLRASKKIYTNLSPIQRVNIARHPNRPTFLDHVFNITEKFVELHGDRAGYDDPAIVTGIGTIDGRRYMFIGHQKGRNTKENIQRNFGMPTPHGYRKALRMMYYAERHGFPIVTFIDTPGAFADLKSEELGQGEAIAHNLRAMFGLKVPVVSIVIGEGGSGGALAIGCANKLLMLENAVFYVASPEACAAILWKSASASPKAAEKLKITARELLKLQVADGVIPEPLGGAHADSSRTSQSIKNAINETMDELMKMDTQELLKHRMLKFRKIGGFQEGIPTYLKKIGKTSELELKSEVEKLKQQILKAEESSTKPPMSDINEMIEKLKREVNLEYSEAVEAIGFKDKFVKLQEEMFKARNSQDQLINEVLKNKYLKLGNELHQSMPAAPNYASLMYKLDMLEEISKAKNLADKNEKAATIKQELELKSSVEKLKQQTLKAGESSTKPPMLDMNEMIEKLKKEVDLEYSEAVEAIGLKDKLVMLREEFSKAGNSQDQLVNKALKDKFQKLSNELEQGMPAAPNYARLMYKLDMLKEISKAKNLAEKNEKAATIKQEVNKKFKEVLDRADVQQKIDTLKAEVEKSGVSTVEDLDDGLKEKIMKLKKEIELELADTLKSSNLDVALQEPRIENLGEEAFTDLKVNVEEFNEEINKKIVDVVESSDLKEKIDLLKLEIAKAGKTPDSEAKKKIEALEQQIKHDLAEAMNNSELKEKHEKLKTEISGATESSGRLDGSLNNNNSTEDPSKYDDSIVEMNLGANRSFV